MINVALICGGISSEHEVSCVSAGGVLKGLDSSKFNPILIGITKAGNWVLLPNDYPLEIVGGKLPTVDEGAPAVVADVHGFQLGAKHSRSMLTFLYCMVPMVKMERFKACLKLQTLPMLVVEF